MISEVFKFKQFDLIQNDKVFKLTTDATLLAAVYENNSIKDKSGIDILEVGSGTGVISLMLAQKFPNAKIKAIDINQDAVDLSDLNFEKSIWSNRLKAEKADFSSYIDDIKYDLIISNPPYFSKNTPSIDKVYHTAKHQINLTYSMLIKKMLTNLKLGGEIALIFPVMYEAEIMMIIEDLKLEKLIKIYIVHTKKVLPKNMILILKTCEAEVPFTHTLKVNKKLVLRNQDNSYSEEYRMYLKNFLNIF